ncbi:hypothetical protein [Salimicrobium humidisoli]|nr:hypothetical protein [Salimicrobium humidisoli]
MRNKDENNFRDDKDLSKIEMASEGATGCGLGCLGVAFVFINFPVFFYIL